VALLPDEELKGNVGIAAAAVCDDAVFQSGPRCDPRMINEPET
jgi:hypothetical protein